MKTLILALAISLAPIVDSSINVYSTTGKDKSGLGPQIDRILSDKEWPDGEVEVTFELDDMNLIRVHDSESNNSQLADEVFEHLQRQEVFPKLNAEQELYVFNLSFGKKQRKTFRLRQN